MSRYPRKYGKPMGESRSTVGYVLRDGRVVITARMVKENIEQIVGAVRVGTMWIWREEL